MFQTTVLNSTAILLTWEVPIDPNGFIISYHLDVSVSTQDSYITETGLDGFNSTLGNGELRDFVLRGLHPYVLYVLRLSAATNVGQGNATLPRESMTQQAGVCVVWVWGGGGGGLLGLCSYCCVGSFSFN